jgi:hypothetical protein
MYARERDVVKLGTITMENLIEIVLNEKMDNSRGVRLSQ